MVDTLHWASVAEKQKLATEMLIPGVIETDIKRENPIARLPGGLVTGTKIRYNREKTVLDGDVKRFSSGGETTVWTNDMEHTSVEATTKKCYIARLVDNEDLVRYGTWFNAKQSATKSAIKGIDRALGDRLIYDDTTYGGTDQWDGWHALAAENYGTDFSGLNIDQNGPLSLFNLRTLINLMKHGIDAFYMPACIALRIDAAYEEAGLARFATATAGPLSMITKTPNSAGGMTTYFGGIPIIRTDYLAKEQDSTGTGASANARAKWTSSTVTYSVFAIKYGNVINEEPGMGFFYGDPSMSGKFYKLVDYTDIPEKVDAQGIKLISYAVPLMGSPMAIGRIFDVTDAEVVY
jgi:hypothetical protein